MSPCTDNELAATDSVNKTVLLTPNQEVKLKFQIEKERDWSGTQFRIIPITRLGHSLDADY